MKKKTDSRRDERRRDRVEMNLLAADEGVRSAPGKTRRGCVLPIIGMALLAGSLPLLSLHLG
ncbi:MAG: hypothetical protein AUI15_04360 [Actinobacteria bacterium 13_2_20CM_2_66_6]|nr:MAG: hypothetical protein AUI15_04360 [Actinobacteria bacterium 13_2_20CM_2_66_6]